MMYIHQTTCLFSRILHYHFSIKGFTCSAKTTIATIKAVQHFCKWQGGDEALKFFGKQKKLLYTTQFFQQLGEFIRIERTADGNKIYHLQYPQADNGWKKTIKWLKIIGSFFDLVQFIFKKVTRTPSCLIKLSEDIGKKTIKGIEFKQIPVIGSLVRKPKHFCIFVSDAMSIIEFAYDVIWRGYRYNGLELTEKLCKLISFVGKVILTFTRQFNDNDKKTWFRTIDLITQIVSQMKFSISVELNNRSLIHNGHYRV